MGTGGVPRDDSSVSLSGTFTRSGALAVGEGLRAAVGVVALDASTGVAAPVGSATAFGGFPWCRSRRSFRWALISETDWRIRLIGPGPWKGAIVVGILSLTR